MKIEWGAAQKTLKDLVGESGHELGVFRVRGLWQKGLGYTVRKVPCKRCGRVFTITFCPGQGFIMKPDDLHGRCESSELKHGAGTMNNRCCGHHCPVCGSAARPLHGFCKDPSCNCEADMPWRMKLGRTAHKCFGGQHRFDIDTETGRALPDYLYRLPDGTTQTASAGTKLPPWQEPKHSAPHPQL